MELRKLLTIINLITAVLLMACTDDMDDICTCPHGGNIGGWEDGDTLDIHKKDSVGAFDVTLNGWGNENPRDITL